MSVRRILLTSDAVGGVWTYSLDLSRALAASGVEVVLATLGPPPSERQRTQAGAVAGVTLVDSGCALDWLAEDAAEVRASARRIAGLAGDHAIDLVQLHAPALAAGATFDRPVVAVAHSCLATWWDAVEQGPLPADFVWRDAATRAGLLAADVTVAPSHAFAAALRRVHRLPGVPRVVHNGRSPLAGPSAGAPAMHAFTAGRLWDPGKDLATLDRAAAMGVPIRAAGSLNGPDGSALRAEHLDCVGALDEAALAAALAERPVFVSAALYEPFGLAVLEAAQAACPLVLADTATFRELWDGAAVFVAPRDAAGFAEALATLIADPDRRVLLGTAAAERAARYTVEAMGHGMLALYAAVGGTRAAA